MKILVTGGAGYIGSFICRMLQEERHDLIVLDNLTYGHRKAIDAPLEVGDLGDDAFLDGVFARHRPDGVMHVAAWIDVAESVSNPAKYFANNTGNTALLLQKMAKFKVHNLIFSSTAAVYGTPKTLPLTESSLTQPDSPYGLSKLLTDLSIPWYAQAYGLQAISLRYFNAAGAALDGSSGEDHEPATHLITNAVKAASGQKPFTLFGSDYDTADGSCIRDYIHVLDIASAHVVALRHLKAGGTGAVYNVGTGTGTSNVEVIDAVKRISGIDFPVTIGPRRPGDPARLVADASRLQEDLDWHPQHSDLDTIVSSSWKWQSGHPQGYRD